MDDLNSNKKAWDNIGEKVASPYIKNKKYLGLFNQFCERLPENAAVLIWAAVLDCPLPRNWLIGDLM